MRTKMRCAWLVAALLASSPATAWVDTATQAMPLRLVTTGPVAAATPMRIVVGLRLRDRAALEAFIDRLTTPGDPAYNQLMPPAQFAAAHLPTPAQATAMQDYLRAQGFTAIELAANRMMISATGTAAIVQKAFNTRLASYSLDGRAVYSNVTPAQVPEHLGSTVLNVSGLQNFALYQSQPAAAPALLKSVEGYSPQALWKAYQAGATWGGPARIAIIMSGRTDTVRADLNLYRGIYGLPGVPVTDVNVNGGSTNNNAHAEWALDTQAATGMAGSVAELRLYNAPSLSPGDLALAINRFVTDRAANAASHSLVICEVLPWLSGDMELTDQVLAQAVASHGQTLFASTGDSGSACALARIVHVPAPLAGIPMQNYPATSPYATAVGGTTLLVDSAGNWSQETAWPATGGGYSYLEPAPGWQSGKVPAKAVGKGIPDLAMLGDPNTGMTVYIAGARRVVGGTSLSAPLALGVWARLQAAHGGTLGFAAARFYQVTLNALATPLVNRPSPNGFRDILAGCNGLYCATPKWDFVSGVGTPSIENLNWALR